MARHATGSIRRLALQAAASASALSPRAALLAIGTAFVVFLWVLAVAPPLVSCALAAALAIAWCVWLDEHADRRADDEVRPESMGAVPHSTSVVHVLATTAEGTTGALEAARQLTSGTDGKVVLFVPRLTTSGAPFDPSGEERNAILDRYRQIAADAGVHVSVVFCVCARLEDVVHQMLGPSTLLIVGGRSRAWWPTRERRLLDRLVGQGYPVVFADVGAAHRRGIDVLRVFRNS